MESLKVSPGSSHVVASNPTLKLGLGLQFENLYEHDGLRHLDKLFCEDLTQAEPDLAQRLFSARTAPDNLTHLQESQLIIDIAPYLEEFIARLFGITNEVQALAARHNELAPLLHCKRHFVQRRALQKYKAVEAGSFDGEALQKTLLKFLNTGAVTFSEMDFVRQVNSWLEDELANTDKLDVAERYAAWAAQADAGKLRYRQGVLFKVPAKLDFKHLVHVVPVEGLHYAAYTLSKNHMRQREGFALTDQGTD
ncbi:MAG: pyridine nucleotide-disulfide oxidoreductase, partial [Candidatus Nitrotoga sp.]